MLYYLRLISLILFLAGANSIVFGQCTTIQLAAIPLFPATTFTPLCSQNPQISGTTTTYQYSRVSVIVGYQYNFQSLSLGSAVQTDFITIATDVAAPVALFSGFNGNNGIYWTATFTGTIRFYTHTSAGCLTTVSPRQRKVIMAPFQARIDKTNSLCAGLPGSGQYTITVGPNHGWNSTAVSASQTVINPTISGRLNYTIVGSTAPEIGPSLNTPPSSWFLTSTLTIPFTGYTYSTPFSSSLYTEGTNSFITTNAGPVGTYTSPATIVGNNVSNQSIYVWPSGSISTYNPGCGPYTFYPTITAPPILQFNQSGPTIYSCGSGSVTLSANGGTAPYNISWFNQASSTIVTSPAGNEISASGGNYTIPNLAAGTYTFNLTDANLCPKQQVVTITPPPPGPPIASVSAQATCSIPTGTITVTSPVAASGTSYTLTGTNPVVAAITNTTGIFPNLASGTYQVISTVGGCASPPLTGLVVSAITLPALPTVVVSPATCSSNGTATINNFVSGNTYNFTPSGPTIGLGGLISSMSTGTSYTVTSYNGFCTSSDSAPFTIDIQLITPAAPLVDTTAATCLSDGTATISNYVSGNTYTFNPSGPTVDLTTGVISNMTTGLPYTVTSNNGFCTSSDSAPFTIDIQLVTPAAPLVDTTAATCLSDGTATISNFVSGNTYNFTPIGPTIDASGLISSMSTGTPYTVTSNNGFCTSLDSAPFTIDIQSAPAVDTTAATCFSDGTATISNYDNILTYTFTPIGPTIGLGGVISGLASGLPYTVTTSNVSCASSVPFTIDIQLITPPDPLIDTTAATCFSDGTATISNFVAGQTYVFTPSGPTLDAVGLISGMTPTINYTVTSNIGACSSQSSSLSVDPILIFNVIVDTSICSSNLPFTINAITFLTAGTQVATLIAANGCDSLVTINLSVIANDNSLFSQISPICFGDPLSLPPSSLNGFSGTWSPAIDNTDTTTYTFTPGIGQCGYSATMTIIVYPQVLVTITDTSICTGGTAILIATASPAGGDFFWSNANPTSSITVSPNFTTNYSVFYTSLLYTSSGNCSATASRLLAVNPIPTVTATSAIICDGEIATIVATGLPTGGTYSWSPGAETTAGINISPNTTSNYSVVYSRLGCESPQVNTTVTVKPVPIITLASAVICIGEEVTMTAQTTIAGGVYDWGNGNANETQTFSPISDTTLYLSYSVNGCTSPIESPTITVNPLPISTFSGSPLTGCIPLEVTLIADDNSNTSYSWLASNGLTGTGAQSILTFTSGGVYDITLIAALNGCFKTTTLNNYVEVDNYPIASFVPSSNSFTELTQLLEFTNSSSGAASYTWDFGDGASSTEINPEYTFTNNLNGHVITLTAYSQFLCANIDSVEILFNNGLVYYIPNTFTPNGDEFNQTFKPIFSSSIDVYNFSFYIYNRSGHVIFETHDIEKGWDGLFGEDGTPVPQGTYTYKIIVKYTETDERKEFFGHVNLVR
jgi:gliding motility-associated-like protein